MSFFLNTRIAVLMTTLCVFIAFDCVMRIWYSNIHVLISELLQSKSAFKWIIAENPMIQSWEKQCWTKVTRSWLSVKQHCSVLNFSVLINTDSEKMKTDQLWNSGDQRWRPLCSLNQRWKTSNVWEIAVLEHQPDNQKTRRVINFSMHYTKTWTNFSTVAAHL